MYGQGNPYKIVAVDCGIKHNMIRSLIQVQTIAYPSFVTVVLNTASLIV